MNTCYKHVYGSEGSNAHTPFHSIPTVELLTIWGEGILSGTQTACCLPHYLDKKQCNHCQMCTSLNEWDGLYLQCSPVFLNCVCYWYPLEFHSRPHTIFTCIVLVIYIHGVAQITIVVEYVSKQLVIHIPHSLSHWLTCFTQKLLLLKKYVSFEHCILKCAY